MVNFNDLNVLLDRYDSRPFFFSFNFLQVLLNVLLNPLPELLFHLILEKSYLVLLLDVRAHFFQLFKLVIEAKVLDKIKWYCKGRFDVFGVDGLLIVFGAYVIGLLC